MTNIKYGGYTPPKKVKGKSNFVFGIFFDGTLNNKQNTKEREANSSAYQNNGIKTWKERQLSEKHDTSYDNDWSNVARLWDCYDKSTRIYIEGMGTEDSKKDDSDGFAFGSGTTGIRKKVRKGCEKIVDEIKKANKKKISTLTLDVFGFSRGSAAARNFLYEIEKAKEKPSRVVYTKSKGVAWKEDSDGEHIAIDITELPKRGHLGLMLQNAEITVDRIEIRFLGIYDTVSSYHPNFSASPDFTNDIEELHLNDIGRAKSAVHFVASDEHRENFDLTHSHIGIEKSFPGVHSDVGGSYLTEMEWVREIETSWTTVTDINLFKKKLVDQGWYKDEQLTVEGGNFYFNLAGRRKLDKTYSFIPLQFMSEKGIKQSIPIVQKLLVAKYDFSKDSLLVRVAAKLHKYVFDDGKAYTFKSYKEIHEKYKGAKVPEQRLVDYDRELKEQEDLRTLRNKYLHWSADRYAIGMDPRSDRKRVTY
jgi:Uncharacterized alpha/beta hydrolase domain (DUF2235)